MLGFVALRAFVIGMGARRACEGSLARCYFSVDAADAVGMRAWGDKTENMNARSFEVRRKGKLVKCCRWCMWCPVRPSSQGHFSDGYIAYPGAPLRQPTFAHENCLVHRENTRKPRRPRRATSSIPSRALRHLVSIDLSAERGQVVTQPPFPDTSGCGSAKVPQGSCIRGVTSCMYRPPIQPWIIPLPHQRDTSFLGARCIVTQTAPGGWVPPCRTPHPQMSSPVSDRHSPMISGHNGQPQERGSLSLVCFMPPTHHHLACGLWCGWERDTVI